MTFNINCIVLHAFMFNDSKMMVDVLSREEGRLSCVLNTGRSKASRGRRQLFQPLSILELTLDRKAPGLLATVKDAHVAVAFANTPFDPYKLAISMFLAEFIANVTQSEKESEVLFDYISESLQWLDGARKDFSNFHLVFMMRLTRFVGFFPNLEDYSEGCAFDMQNGCFVDWAPQQRGFLTGDDATKMQTLMRMNYDNMRLFKMSHADRNRCLDVITDYYRLHAADFREMKSLSILRELFA